MENNFLKLLSLNVNDKTEKKPTGGNQSLTYLSWAFAWAEFVKVYPTASYEIVKNSDNLPYFSDKSGAMVYTRVTANNITHEMWLPVMDGSNKAMRAEPYEYQIYDKFKKTYVQKKIEAYTMFDINKTVMRCLVKNLAMFGLGLYIYAGEDLPESPTQSGDDIPKAEVSEEMITKIKSTFEAKYDLIPESHKKKITKIIETKEGRFESVLQYLVNL